ncbi:MAG TPA: hypothetical protein VL086_00825 [Candidatus Nitrosotalea sp.]|nr:hypothetical protein [Candidatus Nitrosotalea sp.]
MRLGPRHRRHGPVVGLGLLALVLLFLSGPAVAQPSSVANVCTTALGWCLLPPGTVVPLTRPCRCFTTAGQPVDGRTHSFDYSQVQRINPSPYLNPHAPAPAQPGITR